MSQYWAHGPAVEFMVDGEGEVLVCVATTDRWASEIARALGWLDTIESPYGGAKDTDVERLLTLNKRLNEERNTWRSRARLLIDEMHGAADELHVKCALSENAHAVAARLRGSANLARLTGAPIARAARSDGFLATWAELHGVEPKPVERSDRNDYVDRFATSLLPLLQRPMGPVPTSKRLQEACDHPRASVMRPAGTRYLVCGECGASMGLA